MPKTLKQMAALAELAQMPDPVLKELQKKHPNAVKAAMVQRMKALPLKELAASIKKEVKRRSQQKDPPLPM